MDEAALVSGETGVAGIRINIRINTYKDAYKYVFGGGWEGRALGSVPCAQVQELVHVGRGKCMDEAALVAGAGQGPRWEKRGKSRGELHSCGIVFVQKRGFL